jgi:predicted acetyltransferase
VSYLDHPLDPTSAAALAENSLRLGLVDYDDPAAFHAWMRAEARGFHDGAPATETLEEARGYLRHRRATGVYDDAAATPEPVGTVSSWITPLTVPGPRPLDSWAISAVSVAPTHRRRGIAGALLPAELRTAHALGVPLAILTVSESTIYGRWGFGAAAFASSWSVDTRRVRWVGPATSGRLSFAEPVDYRETGQAVIERANAARPGEIGLSDHLAHRIIGPMAGTPKADRYRLVRYDAADGTPEGFVTYTITPNETDFARNSIEVVALVAATESANAALWRFLLEMDLVGEVRASTRGVDEPLRWFVSDLRGVQQTSVVDHLWVRILDVPAALEARRFEAAGSIVLEIDDPLGFAGGRFRLEVLDTGEAHVRPTGEAADVFLPVSSLGSLYLGHDAAPGLAAAGRITGDADALGRLFRTAVPPRLSSWF